MPEVYLLSPVAAASGLERSFTTQNPHWVGKVSLRTLLAADGQGIGLTEILVDLSEPVDEQIWITTNKHDITEEMIRDDSLAEQIVLVGLRKLPVHLARAQ